MNHGLGDHRKLMPAVIGSERDRSLEEGINGAPKHIDPGRLLRDYEQLLVFRGYF